MSILVRMNKAIEEMDTSSMGKFFMIILNSFSFKWY